VLLAVLVVSGGHARADVTTDQPGSIVLFPKVISDGTRDTLIQITNTSTLSQHAHCIYINASGACSTTTDQACNLDSDCPPTETCVHQCTPTNFDIDLTPQQPTAWLVSIGRQVDPNDGFFGLDPGNVPARGTAFTGELKCIQTDSGDAPIPGNSLKGEATIVTAATGQISVYNGISILALSTPNLPAPPSTVWDLNLNNTVYNACPNNLILNHYAEGATDSFTAATVNTELTLVPCSEDIEDLGLLGGTHARAVFSIINEFESQLSANITFDCWLNRRLTDISSQFNRGTIGSDFAKTRISAPTGTCTAPAAGLPCTSDAQCGNGGTCRGSFKICYSGDNRNGVCSSDTDCPNFQTVNHLTNVCIGGTNQFGSCTTDNDCPGGGFCLIVPPTSLGCRPWTGLLGVAEEFQTITGAGTGHEAVNLHTEGNRPGDVIVVPIGQ